MTKPCVAVEKIAGVFDKLGEELGIQDFITINNGTTRDGYVWTRYSLDLPDGTMLVAFDEDEDAITLLITGARGEISRMQLSNVGESLLFGFALAIVERALLTDGG